MNLTQRRGDAEDINTITGEVIRISMEIHKNLGPGLFETVYELILARKLQDLGLDVARQVPVPIIYEDLRFEEGFRADIMINRRVCLELKSVETLAPVHSKQLLTYLKLLNLEVGLLINFGAPILKEGLHRIVNQYQGSLPSAPPRLRVT